MWAEKERSTWSQARIKRKVVSVEPQDWKIDIKAWKIALSQWSGELSHLVEKRRNCHEKRYDWEIKVVTRWNEK